MLGYHLSNALRSMRKNPMLTTLMIAATAFGIGVSMAMITVYYLIAQNPIPKYSDQLYRVQMDSWDPLRPFDEDRPERAPIQLTWRDAMSLLESAPASQQTALFEASLIVTPPNPEQLPYELGARMATGDFFAMFHVPFLYGSPWDNQADLSAEQVVVLSRATNQKLFGGDNSVGEKLNLNNRIFTVTGVLETWEPLPRFYDIVNGPINDVNDLFLPISLTPALEIRSVGSDWAWKSEPINTFEQWLSSEACWLQFWAELPDLGAKEDYLAYLDAYASEQQALGRFQRPINNPIHNVAEWLDYNEVVPNEVRLMVGIGFLFLMVCLLSSISLLLTKFTSRMPEISLRRALGASRNNILGQQLVEIMLIGIVGGLIGVGITRISLIGMAESVSQAPAGLFEMNWTLIGMAILLSAIASLLAGMYPAWRSCLVEPANMLKNQ